MTFNKRLMLLTLALCFTAATITASTFEERRSHILNHYAKSYPNDKFWGDNDIKTAMGFVLARLEKKVDTKRALDMLDRMQDDSFDMFDRHQNIDAFMRFRSIYPKALKEKVRQKMIDCDYTADGSTENHKLMFKTAGYLTALAFPDWTNADATMQHCRTELLKTMDETVHYGIKEFDSPTYGTFYITCLMSLYDHTNDEKFKKRVAMTLEWHLLNMAPEWLNGYLVSSSLREYEFVCSPRMESPYPLVGWLLFGGGRTPALDQIYVDGELQVNNEGFFSVLAAISSFRVPQIIQNIASDRTKAYVHKESHDMNPMSQLNYPWGFRKYSFLNKHYGLTSQWDGLSLGWSAQMRRWKLVWESDAPAGTFFLTHPCYYEGSAQSLIGATPREQLLQHNGTLLAMYKIESGEPYGYITGVVPIEAIKQVKEDVSGWIFFDGGTVLFGVKFFHPYTWDDNRSFRGVVHRMLRCNQRGTAVAIETCLPEEYKATASKSSLDLFAEDVLKKTKLDYIVKDPEYREAIYQSLKGDTLKMVYNYGRFVNDVKVAYDQWPLYDNPWMQQSVNGRFLNLTFDGQARVYDFNEWTVVDTQHK